MKKLTVVFLIVAALVLTGYVALRHYLNTPGFHPPAPPAAKLATRSEETPLDIRPQLIKKIQELVQKGSDGLYNILSVNLNPTSFPPQFF